MIEQVLMMIIRNHKMVSKDILMCYCALLYGTIYFRYNWRVTCRSVIFRIEPIQITGFFSHFVYKGTTKLNFGKPQFIKLSTKSCMSQTMNNLKETFSP